MHRRTRRAFVPLTLASTLVCTVTVAQVREASNATSAVNSNSNESSDAAVARDDALSQVIVTARRRTENVQTVPIAITVVTQQALTDNNVHTLGDLQALIPSLTSVTAFSRDSVNLSIRGQGTNSVSGQPGVIAYLNEVPVPTMIGGDLAGGPGFLFDLENVQALKGPQGTLFGRNSVGGALLLQSARPTNAFGGRLQATYGNYNDREIDGAVNVPLVDEVLLARIAVNGQVRDGFTQLMADPQHPGGIDTDDRDFWSVRGTLTFRAGERFQNDAIAGYSNYQSHGSPLIITNLAPNGPAASALPILNSLFAQQQAFGPRRVIATNVPLASSGSNLSLENISRLTVADGLTVRNIFGYDRASSIIATDFDGTVLPLLEPTSTPQELVTRQYTDELQLLGKSLASRLDWLVGGFYLHSLDEPYIQTQTIFFAPSDKITGGPTNSKALFTQGTYDLSEWVPDVKFTAGARYTWDNNTNNVRGGHTGSVCLAPTVDCSTSTSYRVTSSALTWTLGLDYQVAPDTLLYIASRRGYRAGGSNRPPGSHPQFDPEYVLDEELGIKSDWRLAEVPIRTNIAVYHQSYQNIQVQQQVLDSSSGGLSLTTTNAAGARIWGAELEALARVTPDLQIGASFDYLSFAYTKFDTGVDPTTLLATRTAGRPPRKAGANARYHLPLAPQTGDVSLQVNWSWQASNGDVSQPGGLIGSYDLLNANLDWNAVAGSALDASLFVSNLTNKTYVNGAVAIYDQAGISSQRFGEPRMYGIRLRYRFGAEGH
jgi:iron complex outermembrane receptor protein